jgi:hypothetical protein
MEEVKQKSLSPFDYIKSITETKSNLMVDDATEKAYVPFVINNGLSTDKECLIMVHEMNIRPNISKRMQYDFLLNMISKKRRYMKYPKSATKSENLGIIQEYYKCNSQKAFEILSILNDEQVSILRTKITNRGGKNE